jgi:hypothetical protein
MISLDDRQRKVVDEMTARLKAALGDRLVSAVLYGTATQGERVAERELALLVVLADLELATLRRLGEPFAYWRKKGFSTPRIFSPDLLASSRDIFPIELMDLTVHREILAGSDPVVDLVVDDEHLRIQCEREIVEKLMRLREAFAESDGKDKELRRLLIDSFPVFAQVLRGALRLVGQPVPDRPVEVARAFCQAAALDARAFVEVDELRHGKNGVGVDDLFDRYYRELSRAAEFIDRHVVADAATTRKGATQ